MSDQIFRKKSLDRISSPEQLNDYIRVANPGIWMILAAVVILLAGVCVWGIFGHLDTKTETVGTAKAGKITCYIKETDIRNVKKGTPAYIDGKEYEIAEISETPVKLKEGQLESAAFAVDESVYTATIHTGLADGIYKVELVTNRVSPMSFVIN